MCRMLEVQVRKLLGNNVTFLWLSVGGLEAEIRVISAQDQALQTEYLLLSASQPIVGLYSQPFSGL